MHFQMPEPGLLHRQYSSVEPLPKRRPRALGHRPQRFFSRLLPPDEHSESNCEPASSVEQECGLAATSLNEISAAAPAPSGARRAKKKKFARFSRMTRSVNGGRQSE